MTGLHIQHPVFLALPLLLVPLLAVLAWRSRAEIGRRGRALSLAVRCLWAVACAAALSAPWMGQRRDEPVATKVLFVRDASRSVADAADEAARAEQAVRDAIGRAGGANPSAPAPSAPAGVTFDSLLFAATTWQPGETPAGAAALDETDIAGALDDANRRSIQSPRVRVVLLSDGRATRGNAADAAARLAMRGAAVHVVPIGRRRDEPAGSVRVVRTEPSVDAHVGVPGIVRVTLSAEQLTRANVRLLDADGKVVDQRALPVEGSRTLVLHFTPREAGVRHYAVEVDVPGAESTSGTAMAVADARQIPVYVQSPPRVLIADNFPEEMAALKKALEPLNVPVDVVTPDDWPADLSPYAAVVASDWSGKELTDAQRTGLRQYVEERGGGLVFVGGGNVLPARWKANPLAVALPVVLEDKPKELTRKKPQASVVYVVDRSGSMAEPLPSSTGTSVSKMDLVKAAIIASVQTLPENSSVGVVSFDSQPTVLVSPTPVTQKAQIVKEVDTLAPGGGTVIEPAIRQGMGLLAQMSGDKYLVVLTDGIGEQPASNVGFWGAVTADAKKAHYSWTSIAVGTDADQTLLSFLAKEARGKFFYCDTADSLPKVFIQQAKTIKRLAEQKEKPFKPKPGPAADWLKAVSVDDLPELGGRVLAKPREHVDAVLLGEGTEPLLASWQFGLGKVVAFTSDAKAAWGKDWVAWNGYSAFWLQVVQSVMRINPELHVRVRSRQEGNRVTFAYAVTDQQGRPVADLKGGGEAVEAPALAPGSGPATRPTEGPAAAPPEAPTTAPAGGEPASPLPVTWQQVGLGEYQASVEMPADGRNRLISMSLVKGGSGAGTGAAGADGKPSGDGGTEKPIRYYMVAASQRNAEMAQTGPDLPALRAIAEAGQGVCSADPEDIAAACRSQGERRSVLDRVPLWPWLLGLAIILWPVDLAVRKFG